MNMKKIIVNYLQRGKYVLPLYEDIVKIAENCGYTLYLQHLDTYDFFCKGKDNLITKLHYNLTKIPIFIKSLAQIPNNSKLLFIYPHPFGVLLPLFFFLLHKKKCSITLLCIDIDYFRGLNKSLLKDLNNLNSADKLILQTPNMLDRCREVGVKTPAELIYFFDFLTEDMAPLTNGKGDNRVVFAGNYDKATFINQLEKLNYKKIKFSLYGVVNNNSSMPDWVEYRKRFSPKKISEVHGDWGLVWDGSSLENNDVKNQHGQYLRITIPSKAILYISAHLPLIVWKESGIAKFVEENHLGITINSLYEVEEKILLVTAEEKEFIRENVKCFAEKLRNGEMLTAVLNKNN
jgi:hypothetical protein